MEKSFREALDAGEWIGPEFREEYDAAILECGLKVQRYNCTAMSSVREMRDAFSDISGKGIPEDSVVIFPFRCDLGFNISVGRDVLVNYNCTFLDTARITVGDHTKIGPDCHRVTAVHRKDFMERRTHKVRGEPIVIGEDCWLGANVTVLPGVRIGNRCIIGAGSVVTKNVPDDSVWVGNPAGSVNKEL